MAEALTLFFSKYLGLWSIDGLGLSVLLKGEGLLIRILQNSPWAGAASTTMEW